MKGYEHEKGKDDILKEEDFARVDVEATQTVDIINFVKIDDVNPLLFYKPYYLEVGKGRRQSLRTTEGISVRHVPATYPVMG